MSVAGGVGSPGQHDPGLLVIEDPRALVPGFSQQAGIEQGLDYGRFLQPACLLRRSA